MPQKWNPQWSARKLAEEIAGSFTGSSKDELKMHPHKLQKVQLPSEKSNASRLQHAKSEMQVHEWPTLQIEKLLKSSKIPCMTGIGLIPVEVMPFSQETS